MPAVGRSRLQRSTRAGLRGASSATADARTTRCGTRDSRGRGRPDDHELQRVERGHADRAGLRARVTRATTAPGASTASPPRAHLTARGTGSHFVRERFGRAPINERRWTSASATPRSRRAPCRRGCPAFLMPSARFSEPNASRRSSGIASRRSVSRRAMPPARGAPERVVRTFESEPMHADPPRADAIDGAPRFASVVGEKQMRAGCRGGGQLAVAAWPHARSSRPRAAALGGGSSIGRTPHAARQSSTSSASHACACNDRPALGVASISSSQSGGTCGQSAVRRRPDPARA